MEKRWSEGVWLGKTSRSDEHVISLEGGRIAKASSIVIKPENESWNAGKILAVKWSQMESMHLELKDETQDLTDIYQTEPEDKHMKLNPDKEYLHMNELEGKTIVNKFQKQIESIKIQEVMSEMDR